MDPLLENETDADLREERKKRERGLEPKAKIQTREGNEYLIVLEDEDGDYHCHRYIRSWRDGSYDCSYDAQNVGIQTVFEWLNDPKAIS